jgi:hypothetical protein
MAFEEYVMVIAVMLISATVIIWPAAVICRRAGYSPWLGLIAIVPLAQIVLLWFIAFSPWGAEGAGHRSAGRPWQVFFSFVRSLRARIQMIGLPHQP